MAANVVYSDGSFYMCIDMATHLYAVHVIMGNVMSPLPFCDVTKKEL